MTLIYRRTKNLRAVQLLLGHSKLESTVRYPGVEVDDALEISEQTEIGQVEGGRAGLWGWLRPLPTTATWNWIELAVPAMSGPTVRQRESRDKTDLSRSAEGLAMPAIGHERTSQSSPQSRQLHRSTRQGSW